MEEFIRKKDLGGGISNRRTMTEANRWAQYVSRHGNASNWQRTHIIN